MDTADEVLAHFGIRGMKWGVRKQEGPRNDAVGVAGVKLNTGARTEMEIGVYGKGPALSKADHKTLNTVADHAVIGMHSLAADKEIKTYNVASFKAHPIGSTWGAAQQDKYTKHVAGILEKHANSTLASPFAASLQSIPGENYLLLAVGTKTALNTWKNSAVHADNFGVLTKKIMPIRDANGFIIDFTDGESVMQSGVKTADDILAHFGIRGMKWGVRKAEPSSGHGPRPGKDSISGPDAVRARQARKMAKDFGVSSLSNADLKFLTERRTLETKYAQLFPRKKSLLEKGAREVAHILLGIGKQQAQSALNKKATEFMNKSALETAIEIGKHSPGYGRHLLR